MPNKDNINAVIAAIKQAGNNPKHPGVGFSMEYHYYSPARPADRSDFQCSTVACIAGWTNLASGHRNPGDEQHAMDFLGIAYDTAQALFYPGWVGEVSDVDAYTATPAQAVRVLELLRDTGKADWVSAMKDKAVEPA